MTKRAIELYCLHKINQNSTKIRKRYHRFYDEDQAKEFISRLNKFSEVLKIWQIGIDKNNKVYYRQELWFERYVVK